MGVPRRTPTGNCTNLLKAQKLIEKLEVVQPQAKRDPCRYFLQVVKEGFVCEVFPKQINTVVCYDTTRLRRTCSVQGQCCRHFGL